MKLDFNGLMTLVAATGSVTLGVALYTLHQQDAHATSPGHAETQTAVGRLEEKVESIEKTTQEIKSELKEQREDVSTKLDELLRRQR